MSDKSSLANALGKSAAHFDADRINSLLDMFEDWALTGHEIRKKVALHQVRNGDIKMDLHSTNSVADSLLGVFSGKNYKVGISKPKVVL